MTTVRTRFAPSPTGFLHVGSARTALFNWAFARHSEGRFVLRIEDTDRERSTAESERAVLEGLEWLGIDWDEGPFRQSERRERHAEVIETLLERDRAYRCVCTQQQLEERKAAAIERGEKWTYDGRCRELALGPDCGPHTVRLRLPAEGPLGWDDLVFGPSGQDAREIGDMIVRRSDGNPLYNLAVVVDDLDMQITHVVRGADHQINTALQIAIYRALDREPPRFAHVPLIVGAGGKKLSKRRDSVSIQEFRDGGFPPEAVCNWLIRIGWSHGDQEIFSRDEIAALFDLADVNRSNAQADPQKLEALSLHHIKEMPAEPLMRAFVPFLERELGSGVEATPELARLADLLRERSHTWVEMAERARFLVDKEVAYDEKAVKKWLKPAVEAPLADFHSGAAALDDWSEAPLEALFEAVRARHDDIGKGKLAQPIRVAITGSSASPGLFETLAVLGKERSVERIGAALERLRSG